MGYSHFWRRPVVISSTAWLPIQADVRRLVNASPVPLVWGYDEPSWKPETSSNLIAFNGLGEAGCEDFSFARFWGGRYGRHPDAEGRTFGFCKTNYRRYDVLVCGGLIVLKHRLGDSIIVETDGGDEDWQPARDFCLKTLGYGARFHIQGRTLLDVNRIPDAEPTKEAV